MLRPCYGRKNSARPAREGPERSPAGQLLVDAGGGKGGGVDGRFQKSTALRAAWAEPSVSFDTAEVPPADMQRSTTHHHFRDPQKEQRVADYYHALAHIVSDAFIEQCHTVKEITGGNALAGGFFVASGMSTNSRIVVTGAQLLLSEELKAQIQLVE